MRNEVRLLLLFLGIFEVSVRQLPSCASERVRVDSLQTIVRLCLEYDGMSTYNRARERWSMRGGCRIALVFGTGVRLEFPAGFDAEELARAVRALGGGRPCWAWVRV